MSREVKRVPLDFDWPLNMVWKGYVQPESLDSDPCLDCDGGQTHAGWWLQRICQRLSILAADIDGQQRGRPLHPWLADDPYPYSRDGRVIRPSPDIVTLIAALARCPELEVASSFGNYDYAIYGAIVAAAGLPEWGSCATCNGEGSLERYPGQRAEAERWERAEPPSGEGWQLWESVSEGSPVSPVFLNAEELARWMITYRGSWAAGCRDGLTLEQARRFVAAGWAASAYGDGTRVADGVTHVSSREGSS